jgi:hypothetical protein
VRKPFYARYDPDATWFDQLRPAFGRDKFFFEEDGQGAPAAPLAAPVTVLPRRVIPLVA